MDILRSIAIAFSTYSTIPMPGFQWDKRCYDRSLDFFPLVGAALSGILFLIHRGCQLLGISQVSAAVILSAAVVAFTGGFHIDGFMDTIDALCSHRSQGEKIEIMKDSHTGAFGVIWLLVLAGLFTAGIFEAAGKGSLNSLLYAFVISRSLSGISVASFKRRDDNSSLIHFDSAVQKVSTVLIMISYIAIATVLMLHSADMAALAATLCCVVWLLISRVLYEKEFGGISGDTCGHFLCICELVYFAAFVVISGIRW